MFPFKKHKNNLDSTQSIKSTQQDIAIQEVLTDYQVDNQPIINMLTEQQYQNNSLTLNLRLPEDCDPEKIHKELSQRLHIHGIQEINMNITLVKKNSSNLATNAMANKTAQTKTAQKIPTAQPDKDNQSQTNTKNTAPTQASLAPHPRIQHIIVVASGKGGVGKSTTTVNIALALQKLGKKVGVLDADIYGPSIPTMLGVAGIKPSLENDQFVPIDAQGMPMLSIGSLLDDEHTPIAWRGIKATGALMQLYNQTNWPNLDYLIIDLPPGTGDIQLTLAQRIPVTGAVIVTTPQHIALLDAQKGIEMFQKTHIPVLGVVENMALHTCSNCGHTEAIFGAGGGEQLTSNYQVPLLGKLPLASGIREQVDNGKPSVLIDDEYAQYYRQIAENIDNNIEKFAKKHDNKRIF